MHSRFEFEFGSVGFWGEGKTGVPGEKPLGAKREPTTNVSQMWRRYGCLKPGHIDVGDECSDHCTTLNCFPCAEGAFIWV